MAQPINVTVQQGDISKVEADVIVLKYAQEFYGAMGKVATLLAGAGIEAKNLRMKRGEYELFPTNGALATPYVLVIGTAPLKEFTYQTVRDFSWDMLTALKDKMPEARHVAMLLQTSPFGLDTAEAVLAQLGGLLDAQEAGDMSPQLEKISIIELNSKLVEQARQVLDKYLSKAPYAKPLSTLWGFRLYMTEPPQGSEKASDAPSADPIQSAGAGSDTKPHVFVAMPFDEEYDDLFSYGIEAPVHQAGYLCERIDQSVFEGDIFERIKDRIEAASVVVAVLTGGNPNVYLELGYAWGFRRPTILMVDNVENLRFDVRGQRCLVYNKIKDAEKILAEELVALKQRGAI